MHTCCNVNYTFSIPLAFLSENQAPPMIIFLFIGDIFFTLRTIKNNI